MEFLVVVNVCKVDQQMGDTSLSLSLDFKNTDDKRWSLAKITGKIV